MKYIKTFESSQKDIYNIEDYLIRYIDSGEITNTSVSIICKNVFRIELKFNIEVKGMNKLIIVDNIISWLSKKYYCSIIDGKLRVYKYEPNIPYVNYSLVDKVNSVLNESLNNLNSYTSIRYPDTEFYGTDINKIILHYSKESKILYIDVNKLFILFENKYMLIYEDILDIIGKKSINKLKLDIDAIKISISAIPISLIDTLEIKDKDIK